MSASKLSRKTCESIESAVLGELPGGKRAELLTQLRGDTTARAYYDRCVDGMRALENATVSEVEYAEVERWLFEDVAAPHEVPSQRGWGLFAWVGVALACAVAMVLSIVGPFEPTLSDEFAVRGGSVRALAVQALCTAPGPRAAQLRSATEHGCSIDGTLAFAYRLEPGSPHDRLGQSRTLSLFGIDAQGDVMYYAPTPADSGPLAAHGGDTQALGMSIRLRRNHAMGEVRVYAIVTPTALSVDDVDALAKTLDSMGAVVPGADPWHERLPLNHRVAAMCSRGCESAELRFVIE